MSDYSPFGFNVADIFKNSSMGNSYKPLPPKKDDQYAPFGGGYDGGDYKKPAEATVKPVDEEAKRKDAEKRAMFQSYMDKMEEQDQPFKEQMQGQKVALLKQAGQGLEAQKAMQDPNYQIGSGSALRQRRGEIAPEWAKMNRASRRLERKGYRAQAAEMAGMAEMSRIGMPSITSQDQRNRMSFMNMERDAKAYEAKRDEDMLNQFLRKRNQRDIASYLSEPI